MVYILAVEKTHVFLWIILESLDSPDKQDAFEREHQGLADDGSRLTRSAQFKEEWVFEREIEG